MHISFVCEYLHFRRGRIWDQIIIVFGSSIKIQQIIFFISLRKKTTFLQPKSLPATCNIINCGVSSNFFILKFVLPLLTMTLKHRMSTITMDTGMTMKTMLSETGPLVIKIITFLSTILLIRKNHLITGTRRTCNVHMYQPQFIIDRGPRTCWILRFTQTKLFIVHFPTEICASWCS